MKKYKKFFRFLKEIGVYSQFIKLTNFKSNFHRRKNLNEFLSSTPECYFIYNAFDWFGTLQGYRFWGKINVWWSTYDGKLPADFKKKLRKLDNSKKQ